MEGAAAELERRSRYLSGLIQQQRNKNNGHSKAAEGAQGPEEKEAEVEAPREQAVLVVEGSKEEASDRAEVLPDPLKGQRRGGGAGSGGGASWREQPKLVRVRGTDMVPELQKRAFRCAGEALAGMTRIDSKRLALALKKEFDSSYGPAWHCIVGTSFGSYVTHSLGGFLYFSIDKVYILLFKTAVQPLKHDSPRF